MYRASSSFRAWTLRLPSVVSSSRFSSLNVSDWLTAGALTIASRIRSWMSRSSSSASCRTTRPAAPIGPGSEAWGSATVPPCDEQPEPDVEPAESEGHQRITPCSRGKKRECAQGHEAQPHERHGPNRVGTAGHDAGSVEQKPGAGERGEEPRANQHQREQNPNQRGRQIAEDEATSRVGENRSAGAPSLGSHRGAPDCERHGGGREPGGQPDGGSAVAVRKARRDKPGNPHGDPTPARDRGKRGGALHGLPDERQVV